MRQKQAIKTELNYTRLLLESDDLTKRARVHLEKKKKILESELNCISLLGYCARKEDRGDE